MKNKRVQFVSSVAVLIATLYSGAAFSRTCDSLDRRDMVEQLDCYCNPKDRSIVQQELASIGSLAKSFSVSTPSDCASATLLTLVASKDSNAESAVSKELSSLGYSSDQIRSIVGTAAKRVAAAKLVQSGSCSSSSYTVTFGPFKFGNKGRDPQCLELDKLEPNEREAAYTLAMVIGFYRTQKQSLFSDQFQKLEKAGEIVAHYPAPRISKCLKITDDLNAINQCLDSPADDEKIQGCISLNMMSSNAMQCLQTRADLSMIQACKSLNLMESNTLACLNKTASLETIRGCRLLNLMESNTLRCIEMGASYETDVSCHELRLMESNTLECLRMNPSSELASECRNLNLMESNTLECLRIKASPSVASACKSLNLMESNTLACLQSGAQPDKINQCGAQNLLESQTLDCIRR